MMGAALPLSPGFDREEAEVGSTGALASSDPDPTWIDRPVPPLAPATPPPTDGFPVKLPGANDEIPFFPVM
jgi:hypothetical protein